MLTGGNARAGTASDPAGSSSSESADPAKNKAGYTLFNPTPTGLLREFNTDRPSRTEGPFTVDAGRFQLEMDFATFTLDRNAGVNTRVLNVAPVNLKFGLLNQVDLEVIFDGYLHQRVVDRTVEGANPGGSGHRRTIENTDGVGDLTVRMKFNLWGDDGGTTAFGLLPFVKIPTNTHHLGNDAVEGGVIFPLAVTLPGKFDLGVQGEVDCLRNETGHGRHAEFAQGITVAHDLVGKLSGYVEFFSTVSTERGSNWVGTADAGLLYKLTDNVQLDAGCDVGVTHAADDVQPFTGLSVRF